MGRQEVSVRTLAYLAIVIAVLWPFVFEVLMAERRRKIRDRKARLEKQQREAADDRA
jgi:hypothetical protein